LTKCLKEWKTQENRTGRTGRTEGVKQAEHGKINPKVPKIGVEKPKRAEDSQNESFVILKGFPFNNGE
jgi:hypothetical protein